MTILRYTRTTKSLPQNKSIAKGLNYQLKWKWERVRTDVTYYQWPRGTGEIARMGVLGGGNIRPSTRQLTPKGVNSQFRPIRRFLMEMPTQRVIKLTRNWTYVMFFSYFAFVTKKKGT